MKNKIYVLTTLLFLIAGVVKAQNSYAFTYTTAPYVPLVSPTITINNNSLAWFTGSSLTLPLGFNFNYWGTNYTSLIYNPYAYCSFAGSYGFYPFYTYLKPIGNSQIGYEISGSPGNKIAKIEWKHVGFLNDPTGSDSVTFQVWLYETLNKVEFHFGNWSVAPADYNAVFGSSSGNQVLFSNPTLSSFYNLQGNPTSPTALYKPTTFIYLSGIPSSGQVYAFSPLSQGSAPVSVFSFPSASCTGAVLTPTNNSTGTPTPAYSWSVTPSVGVTLSPNSSTVAPQIVFAVAGSYTVTCQVTNSVSSSMSAKTISISQCDVGLSEENLLSDDIVLMPNPSQGAFNLTALVTDLTKMDIHILNAVGQDVSEPGCISLIGKNIKIDLKDHVAGIYLITINNGNEHFFKRALLIN